MYVMTTRIALNLLPEYQDQIENYLSEQSGKSIAIHSFVSRWEGLDPVLDINGLSINGHEQFYIGRMRFQFAFWSSVLSLHPKFEKVLIEDAELTVKQHTQGRWFVLFDEFGGEPVNQNLSMHSGSEQALSHLFAVFNGTTINLKNIRAGIYRLNGTRRSLRIPTLNVNYKNDQIFASGEILESQGEKALLNFALNGRGLFSNASIRGTLYVEARSSEFFGELMSIYDWQKVSIQSVEGSSRAWINFDGKNIDSIYGDVQLSEMNWKVGKKSLPPVHDLAFSYLWRKHNDQFQLSLEDTGFDWAGLHCDPGDLRIKEIQSSLLIELEKMKLQCASRLLQALDLPSETLNERLYQSSPKGYLKNIHVSFNAADSAFTLDAFLEGVSINAYDGAPSGKNLNGFLHADNDSGYVSFLSEGFELGFPDLFLEPWDIKLAEGRVNWQIDDHDVHIFSEGLRLWRDEQSLIYGDFILRLNPDDEEDYLGLALGMQNILFTDAVKFVPYHAVDHGLYDWLKTSLVEGQVSSGIYYGYGSIERQHTENSFTSSLHLVTDNGGLKFDPQWPLLADLNAQIFLQNGQLAIQAESAKIANTELQDLIAFMPERVGDQANSIAIKASSTISREGINYWLSESPISHTTRPIAEQLNINASAKTQLHLNIPVAEPDNPDHAHKLTYDVSVALEDAQIEHPDSNLVFSKVKGVVRVDSASGVSVKNMRVQVFDKPANLSIQTEYLKAADRRAESIETDSVNPSKRTTLTRLVLSGQAGMAALFGYLDLQKPHAISGDINYTARLTLSDNEKQYPMLIVNSDLRGLHCACPEPFYKQADKPAPLYLSLLLKPEQSYIEGRITAQDMPEIYTELLLIEGSPTFGEVLIGGAKVSDTQIKGLNIAANLGHAELNSWLMFLNTNLNQGQGMTQPGAEHSDAAASNTSSVPGGHFLKQVQVQIDDMNAYDYSLKDTVLKISQDALNQWQIQAEGKDILGNISLGTAASPLILNFAKLNLAKNAIPPSLLKQAPSPKLNDSNRSISPDDLPEINFRADSLLLSGHPVGAWQFELRHDKGRALFRNIRGHYKGVNVTGQINWRAESDTQSSIATLAIDGRDVESVFEMLDFPKLISSERLKTDIAVVWSGTPFDFSIDKLSGKVSLDMESGFIKTEDEKTGALRLFGVLNAESIKRRLKLDFSDLYKSGIGYYTFRGVATINNGLLRLSEPLEIEGPAGSYLINGRSDLATRALDFDMLVELPFSQNFPLAALVLGAPQVGGLVWVADKLLGEPLSALTTSRYDITGTWDQPRVDLHQAVNASKKDRSHEKDMRDSRK
jgi:uncharacterized protein (TIGR02099 family)